MNEQSRHESTGGVRRVTVASRGHQVLNDPEISKGTAFTAEERRLFALEGLLPSSIETIEEQLERQRHKYDQLHDDMERHIYLRALQDSNEVLFYRFLATNLDELMPIVYTPTVGAACQLFSHIYRRPHGVFVSYPDRDRLMDQFAAISEDIDVIVVTDGQRILGLGDQGVGGMGIPIGKLSLYTAAGGIDPLRTLPVTLDVGTDNRALLDDPLYLGWRHERIGAEEYEAFIEQFITTVEARFPNVLLQWEDFAGHNAAPLLDRYRHRLRSFNDDIQGTAAVALGAIEAAVAMTGEPLTEQRICIVGAGSAGIGIAEMLRDAIAADGAPDAASQLFLTDRAGLLHDRRDDLNEFQHPFAQRSDVIAGWTSTSTASESGRIDLATVVANARPTVLVGVSGAAGVFTEEIIRTMGAAVERPIVMPMSNPTSRAEATPADILTWTGGRALVATGSPFDPVAIDGRLITISQANNVYAFPGIGLGAIISEASEITDAMFVAAAGAIAHHSQGRVDSDDGLLPPIGEVAAVSRRVASAVARSAVADGVCRPLSDAEIEARIDAYWWHPEYPELVPDHTAM